MNIPDLLRRHALVAMVDTTPTYAPIPTPVVVANPCGDCGCAYSEHGDRAIVACAGGQAVFSDGNGVARPYRRRCGCAGWRAA